MNNLPEICSMAISTGTEREEEDEEVEEREEDEGGTL